MNNESSTLYAPIRRRQTLFFGHLIRSEAPENIVLAGNFNGKRSRGKQRQMLLDGGKWLHG